MIAGLGWKNQSELLNCSEGLTLESAKWITRRPWLKPLLAAAAKIEIEEYAPGVVIVSIPELVVLAES
jgi:hypothetical protein